MLRNQLDPRRGQTTDWTGRDGKITSRPSCRSNLSEAKEAIYAYIGSAAGFHNRKDLVESHIRAVVEEAAGRIVDAELVACDGRSPGFVDRHEGGTSERPRRSPPLLIVNGMILSHRLAPRIEQLRRRRNTETAIRAQALRRMSASMAHYSPQGLRPYIRSRAGCPRATKRRSPCADHQLSGLVVAGSGGNAQRIFLRPQRPAVPPHPRQARRSRWRVLHQQPGGVVTGGPGYPEKLPAIRFG